MLTSFYYVNINATLKQSCQFFIDPKQEMLKQAKKEFNILTKILKKEEKKKEEITFKIKISKLVSEYQIIKIVILYHIYLEEGDDEDNEVEYSVDCVRGIDYMDSDLRKLHGRNSLNSDNIIVQKVLLLFI
ncbi:hypothetical protein ACTFIW_000845 [Dictyostelium discoideum]